MSAAGLRPEDSSIPTDPDQSEFCGRWFEWYRGYRTVVGENGIEEVIPLEGEPLKDADPGFLPRTREEMERGRRNVLAADEARRERLRNTEAEGPHVSLEDALDELMDEATDEESESDEVYEVTTSTSNRRPSRALPRTNTNPPPPPPAQQETQSRLDDAYTEAQTAVEAAQRVRDRTEARLTNADAELSIVRERLRRIRRQQITAGNFARVFGTREDVNDDDYVSPITSMFVRQAQWGRQNAERQAVLREQAEALRNFADVHGQGTSASSMAVEAVVAATESPAARGAIDAARASIERANAILDRPRYIGDSHTFVPPALLPESAGGDASEESAAGASTRAVFSPPSTTTATRAMNARLAEIYANLPPSTFPSRLAPLSFARRDPPPSEPTFAGLDGDDRPSSPVPETAMHFKLECKICLQQVADTACLPCGHLSMCGWCAEQWVPTREGDRTRPVSKGVRCPCCRGRVKSRVKIYVG